MITRDALVPSSTVCFADSIKTRIETAKLTKEQKARGVFVSLIPLKQGLKLPLIHFNSFLNILFVSLIPLKQGLKHMEKEMLIKLHEEFVSLIPLKQGLKHKRTGGLLVVKQ